MIKHEKIKLSPIEATAYWWINSIREKVSELLIRGSLSDSELEFMDIFYGYTELDWRTIYLELVKDISKDVTSYSVKENSNKVEAFYQDTAKNGHNRINEELSKIVNCPVPDIRLASNYAKDSIIYTTENVASVWSKSAGVTTLPTEYDADYVLTGNDAELAFYNLLVATISALYDQDPHFNSTSIFRDRFCQEYMKNNSDVETEEEIIEMFHHYFNKANDKHVILGRNYQETYSVTLSDMDLIGLESYMDTAKDYAEHILQKDKDQDSSFFCKTLKRSNNQRKIQDDNN